MQATPLIKSTLAALVLGASFTAPARAEVAKETATLGDYTITLHLHPFLTEEDLTILRLVQTSKDALALFVPQADGFAAMAASPDEGFIKNGAPVASVVALGGLPDAATAAQNAVDGCNAAKSAAADCVVILEIAPN